MSFYLADMFRAFGPATFIAALYAGLLLKAARTTLAAEERLRRHLIFIAVPALIAGIAIGAFAFFWADGAASLTEAKMVMEGACLAAALLALLSAPFALRFSAARFVALPIFALLVAILTAQSALVFADDTTTHALTATSVLNTELILNVLAVTIAAAALGAFATAVSHAASRTPIIGLGLLVLAVLIEAAVWGGDVMLGLLQVGWLQVTSARVSLVAKADYYAEAAVYAELALALVLGAAFLLRAPRPASLSDDLAGHARTERRKLKAFALGERRWFRGLAAAMTFIVASMLYYDLYASQPPRLSEATPVTVDDDGTVRIPVDQVKDGTLHRFAYVSSDGHRVRFFLINRFDAEHVAIGVVYDACMICGDKGYIQRGNEIICIACNVRIFVPSIGKAGGCNPIPLKHEEANGDIVIAQLELEKGARFFSEVVSTNVTDPVTGETLVNTDAPFSFEFEGRTYYFTGEESYDTFRDAPDKYGHEPLAPARVSWQPED
ncbi:putative membrane protein/YHS domain-containing protein [Rhodopseudomonas julia]|uniref:Membrane protein/YHS domain-containing protein n=1 Tax=Rhodopseudomonas julia TaxID=200617 RepID=A0ABU0C7G3_9BRAD|nr:Fe-S-containing protein [Rhodopseudomonas julia]MDQ0326463.1 putative membrane protein/YHS domain-containing protein [Rhodopseudomonas julia]